MRKRILALLGTTGFALLLSGCAVNPYVPERKFAAVDDTRLMLLTGSRIPQLVDINDPEPAGMSPLTVLTGDDVDKRFAGSLSNALRFFSNPNPGGNH